MTKSDTNTNTLPSKTDAIVEKARKLTFKEKKELEKLEVDIEKFETEKANVETELNSGNMTPEEITEAAIRLNEINDELDEKEMRWLELSEIE